MTYIFTIISIGKPRLTQHDRWYESKAVTDYWQYKQDLQKLCLFNKLQLKDTLKIIFYLTMPAPWSKTKKLAMNGHPRCHTRSSENRVFSSLVVGRWRMRFVV